ncbi:MAG: Dna2/Cas4 domain-containing protein, partial [Clostridia bacterium]|nr:Dna2/Cas4 domain-containing protein [Clostridia bacterium]
MAWLDKYKPEEREKDEALDARLDTGNDVGDLAMGLFGDFVEVTAKREDGKMDIPKMIERTKEEMAKDTPVICEASFEYNGLYCAVDILKRDGDGWAIYEVKSSTDPEKTVYHADVAYQKYVLEHCGVCVTKTY